MINGKSYLLSLCWICIICSLSNQVWNFFSWVFPWRMVFLRLVKRVVCGLSSCFLCGFPFVPPEVSQLQQSIFSPILIKIICMMSSLSIILKKQWWFFTQILTQWCGITPRIDSLNSLHSNYNMTLLLGRCP